MRLNLSLFQKALVLIAVPLVFQLIVVSILAALRHQAEQEEMQTLHTREKFRHVELILRCVLEQSVQAVITSTTRQIGLPDLQAQDRLKMLTKRVHEESEELKKFVYNNEEERKLFAECDRLQEELGESWRKGRDYMDAGDKINAFLTFKKTQKVAARLLETCDKLNAMEKNLESTELEAESRHRDQIEVFIKAVVLLNIALAVGLAFYFHKGTTRRMGVLMDNTVRLAANIPLNPPLTGDDEIARLDQTFNTMAIELAIAARKERAIIDKALDVICSISPAYRFTRVSPAAETVWGYNPNQLVGTNFTELIAPEDKEKATSAFKAIREGLREEPIEARVVRKDGQVVDIFWSARWSKEDDTIFCIAHDITARKQAENLLKEAESRVRLIVESLPIGLLIIDDGGIIEFTNPYARQMFGLSAGELHRQHIGLLFCPAAEDGATTKKNYAQFKNKLFEGKTLEVEGIKCGGTTFPAEVGMTAFQGTNGQRFLVVILDATQKHAVERMRQEFIAMVSHDLRSPLTSVQTFLELLDSGICGDLNDKGKKKLDTINRDVDRLIALIKDLLDLERFKSGSLVTNKAPVPLSEIVNRSVDAIKVQAEQLKLEIKTDVTGDIVHVDADRIVQAIVNLLSNALKFSEANTMITITGKAHEEWAEVRVTDQGRGIPAEDQRRIFERFQQVEESDAGAKGGTGLGLPICKAIIEQHGGTIGVESEPGKGSTFWFRLPMKQGA